MSRRSNRRFEKKWKRSKHFNKHHIKNKVRGGSASPENMLTMDIERHNAWHFLFKNMDFYEVAQLLLRTIKAKKHQALAA
jgi:hypothetical protein